jgi:amino acid permease
MNTNMQGHNHGGKNHLLGMLGIGAIVLVVLLASGSSLRTALPFAALLACPLMMGAMMFMMMRGGNGEVCCSHRTVTQEGRISPEEEGSLCRNTVSSPRSTATKRC